MERRRRIALGIVAATIMIASSHRPLISVNVAPPREPDAARASAAFDIGRAGVTVLVSWGADRLTR